MNKSSSIRPLLASEADPSAIRYPVLTSPKMDGIRCLNVDGVAVSRTLKPIPNHYIRELLSVPELAGVDGELVAGCTFNQTASAVMSRDGEPVFQFHVFDDFTDPTLPFGQRFLNLGERIMSLPASVQRHIDIVEHSLAFDPVGLEYAETDYLQQGYEGLMLRNPSGVYKFGRSTRKEGILLKLKRFQDAEAVVVDTVELLINHNEQERDAFGLAKRSTAQAGKSRAGKLGALVCERDGIRFEIGTGFTQTDREHLWEIRATLPGRVVNFKYQQHGTVIAPRCPVFRGFRSEGV